MTANPTPASTLAAAFAAAQQAAGHAGDGVIVVALRSQHTPLVLHQPVEGFNDDAAVAVGSAGLGVVVIATCAANGAGAALTILHRICRRLAAATGVECTQIYAPSLRAGSCWTNLRLSDGPTAGFIPPVRLGGRLLHNRTRWLQTRLTSGGHR
ncbi:hypothetical protein [Nocardia suismassiliense]|uniref:hypothetical protein n=1 Tax=Nocardia suismassiliense TaxID=2077092 RepID=UPI000D1E4193|nr:hypothetical protein [Nocardia suismassiliense]